MDDFVKSGLGYGLFMRAIISVKIPKMYASDSDIKESDGSCYLPPAASLQFRPPALPDEKSTVPRHQ